MGSNFKLHIYDSRLFFVNYTIQMFVRYKINVDSAQVHILKTISNAVLKRYPFVISMMTHSIKHISWFNFDALAQGAAYKPTKEPINYRGPGGDWTHDLQTEKTPPAASRPARSLHATEIV